MSMQFEPLNVDFGGSAVPRRANRPESLHDGEIESGREGSLMRAKVLRDEIITNDEVKSPYAWFYWRYVTSVVLIVGIVILARVYEDKGALNRDQEYLFNSTVIMLTLLFGLNMTIAYAHFVMLVKAGIIDRHAEDKNYWSFRYEASFAKLSGLRSAIAFMRHGNSTPEKTWLSVLVIGMWIIFNLGMGVAVALIGLTYSLESGTVGFKPGRVSIVDLTGLYSYNKTTDWAAHRFSAKLYADISISYARKTPKAPGKDNEFQLEQLKPAEWRYNFREMDCPGGTTAQSNRWVKANAACKGYNLIRKEDGDYKKFYYSEGPSGQLQDIGPALWDASSTYYISQYNTESAITFPKAFRRCGPDTPRCAHLYVVQLVEDPQATDELMVDFNKSMIYVCNSTVSRVLNAKLPEHELNDNVAFSVASSLASSGLRSKENSTRGIDYSFYHVKAEWGRRAWGNATLIADTIARATIGTIAAMDQLNPRIYVPGQQPWMGEKLNVKWDRLIALLVALAVVQLLGGVISILWYRSQRPQHYHRPVANWENLQPHAL